MLLSFSISIHSIPQKLLIERGPEKSISHPLSLIMTFKCWHLCMSRGHFSKDNATEFIFFVWPLNDFQSCLTYLSLFLVLPFSHLLGSLSEVSSWPSSEKNLLGINDLSLLGQGFRAQSQRKLGLIHKSYNYFFKSSQM